MTTTTTQVHGPIDFVLLEFPLSKAGTGHTADALLDLMDREIIRVYDLMIIAKDADGRVVGIELTGEDEGQVDGFASLASSRSGLLDDDDLEQAAAAMEPDTAAALVVYENLWAVPFVAAAREVGGEMIASARIPADDIMRALEAAEAMR